LEKNVQTIGVIGAGNMGAALVRGLAASGKAAPETIRVFDADTAKSQALQRELGVVSVPTVRGAVDKDTRMLVLAVKPQVLGQVLEGLADSLTDRTVVVSIAAGIPTDFILARLGRPARVIRAMPNAAAMVGAAATALCKAGLADDADLAEAVELFGAIGLAVTVGEGMMNVVTALSGSGPGYVFPMMEALSDGAVLMGMDRPTARALIVQTFLGAASMAAVDGTPFSELKDRITSPGGTTIAGLQVLERSGLRGTLMDVVHAATRRGEELARKS
jgi:pyrroline-5-carboxylate reductase